MRNDKDSIFEDGQYIVQSNSNITVGDMIELTTSSFDFDVVDGKFETNLQHNFNVEVEILDEDLTGYIASKSCDGGAYGYATAVVQEVEMIQ